MNIAQMRSDGLFQRFLRRKILSSAGKNSNSFFVEHENIEIVREVGGEIADYEPSDLLSRYGNFVMVVGQPKFDDQTGILDRWLTTHDEGLSHLEGGAALELDFAQIAFPHLEYFINTVRTALSLPEGASVKAILYLARGGGGFPPHFDAYANLILQLRGRKRWWINDTHPVVDPTEHYDLAQYPAVPEELALYCRDQLKPDLPRGTREVVLEAGSIMYLPRGVWHATESSEETLALNFTMGQPGRLDLLLAALRQRLVAHPEARALTAAGDPGGAAFASLQGHLKAACDAVSEKDLIAAERVDLDPQQTTQLAMRTLYAARRPVL